MPTIWSTKLLTESMEALRILEELWVFWTITLSRLRVVAGDIGRATAGRLSAEGAKVVLLDLIDEGKGNAVAQGFGTHAAYFRTDVADRAAVDRSLASAVSLRGRLDAVISNAGMVANQPFLEIDGENGRRRLL